MGLLRSRRKQKLTPDPFPSTLALSAFTHVP